MKFILWSVVRLFVSALAMFVVVIILALVQGVLYVATGYDLDINENYWVLIPMIAAFLGAFLIGYCPRCKLVVTHRVFAVFWDRFAFDLPRCPKCEKKGKKRDVPQLY